MKKIIISFALIFTCATLVNAQQDTLKPQEGDWGFSLNITGLINNIKIESPGDSLGNYQIYARHYLKNDLALRLGIGINYLNQNWFNADSVNISSGNRALQEIDSSQSRFDFSLSVGLEKHLGNARRLDPYVGANIVLVRIGGTSTTANTDITDVTGTYKIQRIRKMDGGFGFGLGGVAGFNYFITKNFSLGAEFGYAFIYIQAGGDFSESLVETPVSGTQISNFSNGKAKFSQTSLGTVPSGGLMLSFFF